MSLWRLKKSLMKKFRSLLTAIVFFSYPFVVFVALQKQISLHLMAFFLLGIALLNFAQTKQKIVLIMICFLSAFLFYFNNALFLKLYPVLMNTLIGIGFAFSLYKTPLVTIFAKKMGYELSPEVIIYTRKATIAWTVFMFLNMFCSLITVFLSDFIWILYNGFISYVLIGLMFTGEYIIRQRRQNAS